MQKSKEQKYIKVFIYWNRSKCVK